MRGAQVNLTSHPGKTADFHGVKWNKAMVVRSLHLCACLCFIATERRMAQDGGKGKHSGRFPARTRR